MATVDYATRAVPATAEERREAALSFRDQEAIVYQALVTMLGDDAADDDGYVDIWVRDLGSSWVVWQSWCTHGPGPGMWKLSYALDADNAVTFAGDPQPVVAVTSYEPTQRKAGGSLTVLRESMPEARRAVRSALRNVRETRVAPLDWEMREVADGTGSTDLVFTGMACVTDADYEMEDFLGTFTESVAVGAFAKTLRENADVSFLLNHEGMTLARTKSGTMKLSEITAGETTGLHVEARLDAANPQVAAIRSAIDRGDLDSMSFAFRVVRQEWNDDYTRRWINEVNLNYGDASIVNYPANGATAGTVALRGANQLDFALRELRAGRTLPDDMVTSLAEVVDLMQVRRERSTADETDDAAVVAANAEALAQARLTLARNREQEANRRRKAS